MIMKNCYHIILSTLLVLGLSAANPVNALTWRARYASGYCNKLVVSPDTFLQIITLRTPTGSVSCGVESRIIGGNTVTRFHYQLQRKVNGVFQNVGAEKRHDGQTQEYRDLLYGSTYRVKVSVASSTGQDAFSYLNPCSAPIGRVYNQFGWGTFFTNELDIERFNEFNDDDLNGQLVDQHGVPNNDVFCLQTLQNNLNTLIFDCSASFGEDHWQINVEHFDAQGNVAHFTVGPFHDYVQAGQVNIFKEGWEGTFGQWFPGNYEVRIVARRDCQSPWADHIQSFTIVPGTAGCRTSGEEEAATDISIFPNPASTQITLAGFSKGLESEIVYQIFDATGSLKTSGSLTEGDTSIDIANMTNGVYLISIKAGEETFNKRFLVVK